MQKPQIPIFMEITDAEWDEMVRLLCLRERNSKKIRLFFIRATSQKKWELL